MTWRDLKRKELPISNGNRRVEKKELYQEQHPRNGLGSYGKSFSSLYLTHHHTHTSKEKSVEYGCHSNSFRTGPPSVLPHPPPVSFPSSPTFHTPSPAQNLSYIKILNSKKWLRKSGLSPQTPATTAAPLLESDCPSCLLPNLQT